MLALKHDKDLDAARRAIAPEAAVIVAFEFRSDGADHRLSWSPHAEDIATAAPAACVQAVVVREPLAALGHALAGSQPSGPAVVSSSFHLLAALDTTTRPA
jgi:hypothetical protein